MITETLESLGHRVIRIGNSDNLIKNLEKIKEVDIVFNLSEGLRGRNRESQVPIILEMMDIPFVGADGLTLGLTLDKLMTKKILCSEGIPTPRFFEAKDTESLKDLDHLSFPLIVKPRYEGSSKGLSLNSKVNNITELKERIEYIINNYHQPALVEEFIYGREFTIAIIGNSPPQVLPIVQIKIDGRLNLGDRFYTFAHIHSDSLQYVCPAKIPLKLKRRLEDLALKTYEVVECRDFGRIDIRCDYQDNPYILEINPLPSLSTEDVFMVIANYLNISYAEILNRILEAAFQRYGLS
jgi:D-alanine-D-alanine ligase